VKKEKKLLRKKINKLILVLLNLIQWDENAVIHSHFLKTGLTHTLQIYTRIQSSLVLIFKLIQNARRRSATLTWKIRNCLNKFISSINLTFSRVSLNLLKSYSGSYGINKPLFIDDNFMPGNLVELLKLPRARAGENTYLKLCSITGR